MGNIIGEAMGLIGAFLFKNIKWIVIGALAASFLVALNRCQQNAVDAKYYKDKFQSAQAEFIKERQFRLQAEERERKLNQDFSKSRIDADKRKIEVAAIPDKAKIDPSAADAAIQAELERILRHVEQMYSNR